MDILSPWFDFANAEVTGAEQVHNFMVYQKSQVPERLYEWAKDAETIGDQESKASHEQMYNAVLSFIDEISWS